VFYNGKMIAYIQATGEEGDIEIEFSSPWLTNASCIIKTK